MQSFSVKNKSHRTSKTPERFSMENMKENWIAEEVGNLKFWLLHTEWEFGHPWNDQFQPLLQSLCFTIWSSTYLPLFPASILPIKLKHRISLSEKHEEELCLHLTLQVTKIHPYYSRLSKPKAVSCTKPKQVSPASQTGCLDYWLFANDSQVKDTVIPQWVLAQCQFINLITLSDYQVYTFNLQRSWQLWQQWQYLYF